jgi:hypothetical protein
VTTLFADLALDAGLKSLSMVPSKGPFAFLGDMVITTTRAHVAEIRPDVENLVRAMFEGVATFKNDKAKILDLMSTIPTDLMQPPNISIGTGTDEQRELVYGYLWEELADVPMPTVEAISNFYAMALPHYPELKGYNPLSIWDISIVSAILDE